MLLLLWWWSRLWRRLRLLRGGLFVAHEFFDFMHKRFEVNGFSPAHAREFLQQDVEALFAFLESRGRVAGGAFEDVGETASYVGEFLLLLSERQLCAVSHGSTGMRRCTYHPNPVRIHRAIAYAADDLDDFLRKLNRII